MNNHEQPPFRSSARADASEPAFATHISRTAKAGSEANRRADASGRNICARTPGGRNRRRIMHGDTTRMGHQTTLAEQNGSPQTAPRALARDVGEFAHDVFTLAELQAQLF